MPLPNLLSECTLSRVHYCKCTLGAVPVLSGLSDLPLVPEVLKLLREDPRMSTSEFVCILAF